MRDVSQHISCHESHEVAAIGSRRPHPMRTTIRYARNRGRRRSSKFPRARRSARGVAPNEQHKENGQGSLLKECEERRPASTSKSRFCRHCREQENGVERLFYFLPRRSRMQPGPYQRDCPTMMRHWQVRRGLACLFYHDSIETIQRAARACLPS